MGIAVVHCPQTVSVRYLSPFKSVKCKTFLTSAQVIFAVEDSCSVLCMHEGINNASIKVPGFYYVVKKAL